MAFYIFMDGQEVDRVICGPGEETDSPGLYTSAEDYAPFQFADIVTTGAYQMSIHSGVASH